MDMARAGFFMALDQNNKTSPQTTFKVGNSFPGRYHISPG